MKLRVLDDCIDNTSLPFVLVVCLPVEHSTKVLNDGRTREVNYLALVSGRRSEPCRPQQARFRVMLGPIQHLNRS